MALPKPERRSRNRIPVRVPVSVKSPQSQSTKGYTRDLSMNGIFLYTDSQISQGSELEVVLLLPPELASGEKRWVCCQASVVRVEERREGGRLGVAASIRNMAVVPEIPG